MTDQIDKATFDLRDAISGRSYTEKRVPFYLDGEAALEVGRWSNEAEKWSRMGRAEKFDEAEKKMYEAIEKFKGSQYIAVVKDIPRDIKEAILRKVAAQIPNKPDDTSADLVVNQFDVREAEAILRWQAQVVKVINPEGAEQVGLDEETVKHLRNFAPEPAINAIQAQLNEFDEGKGYEIAVRNVDFS